MGGGTPSKTNKAYWDDGSIKWISSKHISEHGSVSGYELISELAIRETAARIAPKNSVILITRVSVGKFAWADDDYAINQDLTALVPKNPLMLDPKYLLAITPHLAQLVEKNAQGIGVRGVTKSFLAEMEIPVPPLEIQHQIVHEIEDQKRKIEELRKEITDREMDIDLAINQVWEE